MGFLSKHNNNPVIIFVSIGHQMSARLFSLKLKPVLILLVADYQIAVENY